MEKAGVNAEHLEIKPTMSGSVRILAFFARSWGLRHVGPDTPVSRSKPGWLGPGSQSGAPQLSKRCAKTSKRLPNRILNIFGRDSGWHPNPAVLGCFGQGDALRALRHCCNAQSPVAHASLGRG
jgi:hypothetical protein